MQVAVPLFGKDVAPRFGFADTFLIAEIEDRQVVRMKRVSIDVNSWASRLNDLKDLDIEILLCGGFNRAFVPLVENLGINIHAGFTGDALELVEAFACGESTPTFTCIGMGRRRFSKKGGQKRKRARKRDRNSQLR